MQFQAYFKSFELNLIKQFLIANQIIQNWRCLFFINIDIFCRLKLEIALAIPASNERKKEANNSVAHAHWCFLTFFLKFNACVFPYFHK